MRPEKEDERKCAREVLKDFNIRMMKFRDPGRKGAPDRLTLLPGGRCLFVEWKQDGKRPRPEQIEYHNWLRSLGHKVMVCTYWRTPYDVIASYVRRETKGK